MHDVNLGIPFESVHLTAFGKDRHIYFEILEEGNIISNINQIYYRNIYNFFS
jgi:hypothetical protein